ncbi:GIY-YIG nuclease family protein [Chloroflexota bacterium]
MKQKCAKWGCIKDATYEKPLCYKHWCEWEAWELDECNRCHYFYDYSLGGFFFLYDLDYQDDYELLCDGCFDLTLYEEGKLKPAEPSEQGPVIIREPERKPVIAHADIERPVRYVYILKLSDATFYTGQTNDLGIRLQEHKDGQQTQTRGKDPKMVYCEPFDGMRKSVDEREMELTILNSTETGRRKIRQLIEKFRTPLRLLDLEA